VSLVALEGKRKTTRCPSEQARKKPHTRDGAGGRKDYGCGPTRLRRGKKTSFNPEGKPLTRGRKVPKAPQPKPCRIRGRERGTRAYRSSCGAKKKGSRRYAWKGAEKSDASFMGMAMVPQALRKEKKIDW